MRNKNSGQAPALDRAVHCSPVFLKGSWALSKFLFKIFSMNYQKAMGKRTARLSEGQVMLITVFALSGTILGATTIAGLLMLYQIRQSTDVGNSTKAIFAADSGLEWRLYKFYKTDKQKCLECPDGGACPAPSLQNESTFQATCTLQGSGTSQSVVIKSIGTSGNNSRALEITLQ
jgi:hypothetical protein